MFKRQGFICSANIWRHLAWSVADDSEHRFPAPGCDELLTIEQTLLTCSDLIEIRESHFTAQLLRVLFQEISPEKNF